jgi:predicted HTH transcriptional regulator
VSRRSPRELELADLNEAALRDLIAEGETDQVERKSDVPADGLGPTVASFANSGGGWILLGVDNEGDVVGFVPKGRVEPQDWLRSVLRKDLDPLPTFGAKVAELDGKEIVVLRVAPSAKTPHLFKPTGAIYVREHGGKQPIGSQAALMALCMTPQQALDAAYKRLTTLPMVLDAIRPQDPGEPVNNQTRVTDWIVAARR